MINIKRLLSTLDIFKERDLKDLEGTQITAEVPVSEELLNLIVGNQAESVGMVEKMTVRLPGNNQLRVFVKARVSTPVFGIKIPVHKNILLELDPHVNLSPSPVLKLRILDGLSGLEKALINWFEKLISRSFPGDVSVGTDTITIDLDSFVRENGWEEWISKIESISLIGEKGRLLVKTGIKI